MIKRIRAKGLFFFLILLVGFFEINRVSAGDDGWTFGLTVGAYAPSLKTLNEVIRTPQTTLLQDPNFQLTPTQTFNVELRNILVPGFEADNAFGFSLGKRFSPKGSFLITLNVWDNVQEATDIVPQITGANVFDSFDVPRVSRYNINVTQLWLGWRFDLYNYSPKNRVYLDVGLLGLSYAQLTIDTLLRVDVPGDVFPIVSSLEAEGFGLTSRWGLGASYAINKWIGISLRGAYVFGRVSRMRVRRFFPSGFSGPLPPDDPNQPVEDRDVGLEPLPERGDRVEIADVVSIDNRNEQRNNKRPLELELDGFEALFALEFYF